MFDYIEIFYNRTRRHSHIGQVSPNDFERAASEPDLTVVYEIGGSPLRAFYTMRNKEKWKPSKYIYKKGRLIASRDPKEVGISSRLIADLIAIFTIEILGNMPRESC